MSRQYIGNDPIPVVVGDAAIEQALDRVVACQECSGALSRSFGSVLAELLGGEGPLPEYILAAPALCPNCAKPLSETSLVRCDGDDLGDYSAESLPGFSPWLH